MATKRYCLWGGDTHATSLAALNSGEGIFKSSALETAAAAAATATAASDTALVSPELGAAAVARPRLRKDSSGSGKKKQQQQEQAAGGAGAKKPPQRGLGVAELERLRCGGDPLLELSVVVGDAAGAQGQGGHPLLHYHHHRHLQMPASAFEAAAGARFCSQLLGPVPPPPPSGPVCVLHPPAAEGCQRAPQVAPEQQYFRDRWSQMGGFSTAGGGADHQSQSQLLPATLAPEHPSSQSTIWRPVVSSSSCLHTGHRCDICSRRMRALAENGGALAPTPPADYSIYDLATAMATARQGDAFLARERKQGAAEDEAPAKKDVREIEFFPAASAHHTGGSGRVSVPNPNESESELTAPFSSPYGAAASHTAPQLDLSLRL
ncbi:hypothetical protein BDA96_09G199200 [Sorghum bicolor]|uniref:Uncharacterized protein n=2 Tax=Sorghum bicolor TaxID=4558 RepID=A0A921QE55_SORBI|nr:hypothetical protein SORBI_3009G188500 [Sorghum bicolor]KAG0518700.1 hypothetical protein BDA96_09G199200 [Sorghum bicolor]